MDLQEDQENNLVTATFELPGLTKENVQINIKDSVLNVSGEPTGPYQASAMRRAIPSTSTALSNS